MHAGPRPQPPLTAADHPTDRRRMKPRALTDGTSLQRKRARNHGGPRCATARTAARHHDDRDRSYGDQPTQVTDSRAPVGLSASDTLGATIRRRAPRRRHPRSRPHP
jgi:hypothetical protein